MIATFTTNVPIASKEFITRNMILVHDVGHAAAEASFLNVFLRPPEKLAPSQY
jgi:hypothetical protein